MTIYSRHVKWEPSTITRGNPIDFQLCENCGRFKNEHGENLACRIPSTPEEINEFIKAGEKPRTKEQIELETALMETMEHRDPVTGNEIAGALLSAIESHIRIYTALAESHLSTSKAGHSLEPIHCWDRGMHTGWGNAATAYLKDLRAITAYFKERMAQ